MAYFGLYKQTTAEYSGQYKRRPMYRELVKQWREHLDRIAKRPKTDFAEAIAAVQRVRQHLNDHDTLADAYGLVEDAHNKTYAALERHRLVNEWRAGAYAWANTFRKKHSLPDRPIPAVE